jgi:hypothetical protein
MKVEKGVKVFWGTAGGIVLLVIAINLIQSYTARHRMTLAQKSYFEERAKKFGVNVKEEPGVEKSYTSSFNFKDAEPGQRWRLMEDDIGLMSKPEIYFDKNEYARNCIAILNSGDTIFVMKKKSIYWKYCKVGELYGWILGDTVKNAKKIN